MSFEASLVVYDSEGFSRLCDLRDLVSHYEKRGFNWLGDNRFFNPVEDCVITVGKGVSCCGELVKSNCNDTSSFRNVYWVNGVIERFVESEGLEVFFSNGVVLTVGVVEKIISFLLFSDDAKSFLQEERFLVISLLAKAVNILSASDPGAVVFYESEYSFL